MNNKYYTPEEFHSIAGAAIDKGLSSWVKAWRDEFSRGKINNPLEYILKLPPTEIALEEASELWIPKDSLERINQVLAGDNNIILSPQELSWMNKALSAKKMTQDQQAYDELLQQIAE